MAQPLESLPDRQKNLKEGLKVLQNYFSQTHDKELLERLKFLEVVIGTPEEESYKQRFLAEYSHKIHEAILSLKDLKDAETMRAWLMLFSENALMRDFYSKYGFAYKLGGTEKGNTDCIRIVRENESLMALIEESPVRFLSEGSDLIYHENFGKNVAQIDRPSFAQLMKYKPTKDKTYIFCLAKPPLEFHGKPNISHILIPTALSADPNTLAVLHASSDKQQVALENNVLDYLERRSFERVFVIEIDHRHPNFEHSSERILQKETGNYENTQYTRPSLSEMSLFPLKNFKLIHPENIGTKAKLKLGVIAEKVDIHEEEIKTLDLLTDNEALKYLVVLTGVREGQIGIKENITEELAYRIGISPDRHSLGLHQTTQVTCGLFNKWLSTLSEKKVQSFGEPLLSWWKEKKDGKEIAWEDLIPYLTTFDITERRYTNVQISTILAYLLLKHLHEDQLQSAYRNYGEVYYGLEEQPENIIALGTAYRANLDVFITGSQQYRLAEIAFALGLIDKNFQFTEKAKNFPEYNAQNQQFSLDGYRGSQTAFLAYLIFKIQYSSDTQYDYEDFKKVYGTTLQNMLCSQKDNDRKNTCSDVIKKIHEIYEQLFGGKPKLLMNESELRGKNTSLNTRLLTFANEGLWVENHFQKLAFDNYQEIQKHTHENGDNPLIDRKLAERSMQTNEVSKISIDTMRKWKNIIEKFIPDDRYYKKYPNVLLAYFASGALLTFKSIVFEKKEAGRTLTDLLDKQFIIISQNFEQKTGKTLSEREKLYIGIQSEVSKKLYDRVSAYEKSFEYFEEQNTIRNPQLLQKKETLSEQEKREKFILDIFHSARILSEKYGLSINFAVAACSIAALETGWDKPANDWGEPTLAKAANNLFSIKYDYKQYTKQDYENQDLGKNDYYIYHTKEYFDLLNPSQYTEHYEAFRQYSSRTDALQDFIKLIEQKYPAVWELAKKKNDENNIVSNTEIVATFIDSLHQAGYATDPKYAELAFSVSNSVIRILRKYGQIV